jgi:hypothetical protein
MSRSEDDAYYHVTPLENLDSILKEGLKAQPSSRTPWESGSRSPRSVHFSLGQADARKWGSQIENAYQLEEERLSDEEERPVEDVSMTMALIKLKNTEGLNIRSQHVPDVKMQEHLVDQDVPPDKLEHVDTFYPGILDS